MPQTSNNIIPSPEKLYQLARDLQQTLRNRAEDTAKLRRLSDETIQDFKDLGFFKILQPIRWGGYEMDPIVFYKVTGIIAEACMTSAWVFSVVAVHNWQISVFGEQAQQDVWGEDNTVLISSSYAPKGIAVAEEGGYRVSGEWDWSSGSDHCNWFFGGAVLDPSVGFESFVTLLIPREDYEIIDNWHVYGLKGTGSKRIKVTDAFVPNYRIHYLKDAFLSENPGKKINPSPLYQLPFGQVFTHSVAVPSLGAYQGALNAFIDGAKSRVSSFGVEAKSNPVTSALIAEATLEIDQMWNTLEANMKSMMDEARNSNKIDVNNRVKFRHQVGTINDRCVAGALKLVKASGGASVYLGHDVMNKFLDIMTTQVHVANISTPFAIDYGSSVLGGETENLML
ncbi:MAG: acyl-CoA dehydrogenase family protein [SAR86 cluster bacterium]|nr:acyl-CoA dehydrogenase family protein [SAR86 cluster bacterium]